MKPLKVGDLARRTGLTVRTLHHYDAIGLLSPSGRSASGHRRYAEDDLACLLHIQSLRQLGFSLHSIRELLRRADDISLGIVQGHLANVREQTRTLRRLGERLEAMAQSMSGGDSVAPKSILQTIEAMTMTEKIYTRTGDDGTTELVGGARVAKASLRVEATGTVDELSTAIGAARTTRLSPAADVLLQEIQLRLFDLGAIVANGVPGELSWAEGTAALEDAIDRVQAGLPPLRGHVVPAGSASATALHTARTACRRTERAVLAVANAPVPPPLVHYLNRLGDLLFVLARQANVEAGVSEVHWPAAAIAPPGRPSGTGRRRPRK
jgi:cob(I)alamin adenosyltransferase